MTTYRYSVPGRIEGKAYCTKELVRRLHDDGCIKKMTIETLCDIVDATANSGCFVGRYAEDTRFEFEIVRERD